MRQGLAGVEVELEQRVGQQAQVLVTEPAAELERCRTQPFEPPRLRQL